MEENEKTENTSYSTENEIQFLQTIGSLRGQQRSRESHLIYLRKYQEAMSRRKNWGRIDSVSVGRVLINMIEELSCLEVVE